MRGLYKKRKAAAGVLAVLAVWLSGGVLTSYGSSYSYDWNSGADMSTILDGWEDEDDQDADHGPGVVSNEGSTLADGPKVTQSEIREQYHEDYKVYEESIEGQFFFYSNVGNGGITNEAVTLDLPANLTWTVEKDGVPWIYERGQSISEYGTYVFRLCGIEDTSVPLSEQKEYRAVFRFRIQEKPPQEETEAAPEGGALSQAAGSYSSALVYNNPASGGLYLGSDGLTGGAAGTEAWEEESQTSGTEIPITGENVTGASEENPEALAEGQAADPSEAAAASADPAENLENLENGQPGIGDGAGIQPENAGDGSQSQSLVQNYDIYGNSYQVTFGDGTVMTASVPDGYVGAGPVELRLPEDGLDRVRLYKDDELLPLDPETGSFLRLEQTGFYRLEAGGGAWSIGLLTATGRMEVYPAPLGMRWTEASVDGETLTLPSENYVLLEKDGQYTLTMEGQEGEQLTVGIRKDTQAPQAEVSLGGGRASIQYLSEDITGILLEKDGESVEDFSGNLVTEPGSYRLTVTDEAGNADTVSFTLRYQINAYGIAAIVMLVCVAAGIAAFVIHTKRTVKIR